MTAAVTGSLAAAYKGKRVLVTGHTGFKGGWLATWLKMMGSRVSGLALPPQPETPSFFESARVAEGMTSVIADIRDFDSVRRVFQEHRPEIVFHNAAQALVRRSYRDPIETYATNVMGTVHILEAVRQASSVRAVVIVTSDKCYENREWIWGYREQDPMGGFDPYSSSKGCAELITAAYRRSFFAANGKRSALVASARAGNVIGGGDWSEDRLVPDLVRGAMGNAKILIRNPGALRPWQHVLDPLYGYLLLGRRLWDRKEKFAEAWNFGPRETSIRVSDVAKRCAMLWAKGNTRSRPRIQFAKNTSALHEAHLLQLDCSKAQARLGWAPRLGVDEMLRWTVDWYKSVIREPRCAQQLTCRQITKYMALASNSNPL